MLKFKAEFVILGSLVWFFSSIFRTKSLITGFMGNWVPCRIAQECAHLFAVNCTAYPKDHSLQATITPYRLSPADCFGFRTCWESWTIGPYWTIGWSKDYLWSCLILFAHPYLKIFKDIESLKSNAGWQMIWGSPRSQSAIYKSLHVTWRRGKGSW